LFYLESESNSFTDVSTNLPLFIDALLSKQQKAKGTPADLLKMFVKFPDFK